MKNLFIRLSRAEKREVQTLVFGLRTAAWSGVKDGQEYLPAKHPSSARITKEAADWATIKIFLDSRISVIPSVDESGHCSFVFYRPVI